MKRLLIALAALLLTLPLAADGGTVVQERIKLKIAESSGDEPLVLELDDMEVGEARQFYTESGKLVTATRNEDDITIDVEGRDEPIVVPMGNSGHGIHLSHGNGQNVVIKKRIHLGDHQSGAGNSVVWIDEDGETHTVEGDGHSFVWIDGEGEHHISEGEDGKSVVWVGEDGETHNLNGKDFVFKTGGAGVHTIALHGGAFEKLESSGALEGLSDEQIERIREALESDTALMEVLGEHGAHGTAVDVRKHVVVIEANEGENDN